MKNCRFWGYLLAALLGCATGAYARQSALSAELGQKAPLRIPTLEGLVPHKHADGEPTDHKDAVQFGWIDVEAALTVDMISNLSGGLKRTTGFLGDLDLLFDIDPAKAGGWKNGHFLVYVLGAYGDNPTEYVGDLQGSSNIESYNTLKIYELWYEHALFDQRFFLLAGLYDYNREFDVLEHAGLFLNSSFGIGVEIAQTGPSIFPATAPAVRGKIALQNGLYLQGAAFDGVPDDSSGSRWTQVNLGSDDGVFYGLEGGIGHGDPADSEYCKLGVGGWYKTTHFADYNGNARTENGGAYLLAETTVLEQLGIFLQLGAAMEDRNQVGRYAGAGLNWNGLFGEDVLGFAVAHARNSDGFMAANGPTDRAETAFELTYQYVFSDHWSLQPDLQYIVNPGMDPTVNNAVVLGVRTTIGF